MNALDYILLSLIALAFACAIFIIIRSKRKGKCIGCSGCCDNCSGCKGKIEKKK